MPGQDAPRHESHHGLIPEERHMGQQPHPEDHSVGSGEDHQYPGHDVRGGNGDAFCLRAGCDARIGCTAGTRWRWTGFRQRHVAVAVASLRSRWGELRQRGDVTRMPWEEQDGIATCYNAGPGLSSTPVTAWR